MVDQSTLKEYVKFSALFIVLIVVIVVAMLIIVKFAVHEAPEKSVPYSKTEEVKLCKDIMCFEESFKVCKPARFNYTWAQTHGYYEITGYEKYDKKSGLCHVSFVQKINNETKNTLHESLCLLNNSMSLRELTQKSRCSGIEQLGSFFDQVDEKNRLSFIGINNTYNCSNIKISGDFTKKLNIIFIADGYPEENMSLFREDVSKFTDVDRKFGPFSVSPFKENLQKINFYRIDSPQNDLANFGSNEEGKYFDFKKIDEVVRSCFKSDISLISYQVILLGNKDNPHSAYASRVPEKGRGYVALFVRTSLEIKPPAGGVASASSCEQNQESCRDLYLSETAVHEFGHSFGDLEDEYFSIRPSSRIERANCDVEGCPKWCSGQVDKNSECYKLFQAKLECLQKQERGENFTCNQQISNDCMKNVSNANISEYRLRLDYCSKKNDEGYNCDIGVGCKEGTGCYFDCGGTNGFRSSPTSVMSADGFEFNTISKEYLIKLLENYS